MRKILLPIFLIACLHTAQAQINLDSLYTVWEDTAGEDSARVNAYHEYIWSGFLFSQPDSAITLTEALEGYATDHQYPRAQAAAYKIQGIAQFFLGDFAAALNLMEESLKIFEQIGDLEGIASSLNSIGTFQKRKGDFVNALNSYDRSLKIREQLGDHRGVNSVLNNIGLVYFSQGDYIKSLEYYTRGLKNSENLWDDNDKAAVLNNIGLVYQNLNDTTKALEYYTRSLNVYERNENRLQLINVLGNIGMIYKARGDLSTAEEYFMRCLSLYNQLGGQSRSTEVFMNLGLVAHDQKNYSTALNYFKQGIAIAEERNDREGTATYLEKLGRVAISQQDYVNGLKYCKRSYAIALDLGALRLQTDGCDCLYTIYKAMGKGDDALTYYELLNTAKEAMNAEETAKKLQQMEFSKAMLKDSIEKAEKDKLVLEAHQEEVRQKNKTRDMLAGGGVLLLILAGGIYSRLRYTRKAKAIIEKEKDRSENLLLNILPEEIAQELKEKGHADAREFERVSILFTDFKSFTEQSAKLSASDLVNEINYCFKAFDGIMEKYGIEKIKTIGDAYMAAGGLPVPTEDSVRNTVLAAFEMQAAIKERKAAMDAAGKPAFEMRVGIHTGPVVAGIVGVKKFQYDIWGDTVNTASRMESNGEVGKVNISQSTYEILKEDPAFVFDSRGKVEAKGKGEIEMYFVSRNLSEG